MKKLLIILLIASGLYSCGWASLDTTKPPIVTRIEEESKETCKYYGNGNVGTSVLLNSMYFCIIDLKGKYNVGDTIKLTK